MEPIKVFMVPDPDGKYYPVDEPLLTALSLTLEQFIECCEPGEGAWHEVNLRPVCEQLFTEARRAALIPDENQGFRLDPTQLTRSTIVKVVESWTGPGLDNVRPTDYGEKLLPVTADRIYNEISARAYPSIASHPAFTKALKLKRPGSEAKTEGTPQSPTETSIPE